MDEHAEIFEYLIHVHNITLQANNSLQQLTFTANWLYQSINQSIIQSVSAAATFVFFSWPNLRLIFIKKTDCCKRRNDSSTISSSSDSSSLELFPTPVQAHPHNWTISTLQWHSYMALIYGLTNIYTNSEWVSSFLTAHQYKIGHSVP